ncbi:MAG: hypothetical protein IJN92_03500 [Lachnospiraceae bacterium]|nr:hypothetical protein [Lachnospiraceae bacterium]
MIALEISNIKLFMNKLLNSEAFDSFYLEEARITTFNEFYIDGRIQKEFYTTEELEENPALLKEFSLWKELRPCCFSLIRGNHTPLHFKLVLHVGDSFFDKLLKSPELTVDPSLIKSLQLIIKYQTGKLTCITGTAFHTFVMDKSLESLWDVALKKSFIAMGIDFSEN